MALSFFGTGEEALLLVALFGRIAGVGKLFAQVNIIPPSSVRILNAYIRESCPAKPEWTWTELPPPGF